MFGAAAACRAKHRRSAVRAEASPCGGSQNSPRGLRPESFCATAIKTDNCLRITKPQNEKNRRETTANEQRFSLPTTSLRRQRTAESTNHADKSRSPCHSGCEVALGEDKTKIIDAEKSPERSAVRRSMNDSQNNAISINSGKKNRAKNNSKENSQRRPNRMCKFVPK